MPDLLAILTRAISPRLNPKVALLGRRYSSLRQCADWGHGFHNYK